MGETLHISFLIFDKMAVDGNGQSFLMKIVVAVLLLVELLTIIFSLLVHGKYFKEMEA